MTQTFFTYYAYYQFITLISVLCKLYDTCNIYTSARSSMIMRTQLTTCCCWPDTWITLSVECGQHWTYTLMCAPLSCSTSNTRCTATLTFFDNYATYITSTSIEKLDKLRHHSVDVGAFATLKATVLQTLKHHNIPIQTSLFYLQSATIILSHEVNKKLSYQKTECQNNKYKYTHQ